MALKTMEMGLVAVLVAMLCAGAAAQSSCTNVIISMSPCLNYISGNTSTPSSSCCSQLASVVRSQPQCLCQVLNGGGSSMGLNINKTQALALPNACNVQTPPVSRCNAASPTASPAGTADAPAGTADSVPSVPSGSGSKTIPSTDRDASDGSITKLSFSMIFCLLFITSYASTLTSF